MNHLLTISKKSGKYHVTCSNNCELGTSAHCDTVEEAQDRVALHRLARSFYVENDLDFAEADR